MNSSEADLDDIISRGWRVGIAAHDAGGAAIIGALTRKFFARNFYARTAGPASKIIDSENVSYCKTDESLFGNIDFLILGSGAGDYEKHFLRKAKAKNIKTGVILDHFVNYKSRFVINNEVVYPEVCYVCDDYSYNLAKKELSDSPLIRKCQNYLLEEWRTLVSKRGFEDKNNILYVLENIEENWDGAGKPWEIAFRNFYESFDGVGCGEKIIVRPHPKDDLSIYKDLLQYPRVVFDCDPSPIGSLCECGVVVGVESYLMYLAHLLGLQVYTSLPVNQRVPRLPAFSYKYFD